MAHTTQDWQRVAEAVSARMEELGFSQTDLAREAKIARETIRKLQQAEPANYQRRTLTTISQALWDSPHAIHRILRGQDPLERQPQRPGERQVTDRWAELDDEQRQRVLGYIDAILDQGL